MNTSNHDESKEGYERKLSRLSRELGPVVKTALDNPNVVEVMLNPDGTLWTDTLGVGLKQVGTMDAVSASCAMRTLSSILGLELTEANPILECELPLDGSRFAGSIPPIVKNPTFAIRKRASLIFTLEDYVGKGMMTAKHAEFLKKSVQNRANILVIGGTGSGKTTFANALLDEVSKVAGTDQRVVIIEDTPELQCAAPNKVELLTNKSVSMTDLLKHTLRMRPDRIVVGEVRGPEALALLKAWNTGHPGGTGTIHANNALAGLTRLSQLIQEANVPPNPHLIAEAVNVCVVITKTHTGSRRISEVIQINGYENGQYLYDEIA